MVKIILIFIATAIAITYLTVLFTDHLYKDYCSTTQIKKLQDSGDYYSCLKEIGK